MLGQTLEIWIALTAALLAAIVRRLMARPARVTAAQRAPRRT
ncbi:MAG: hypothetical protein U0575_15150 [Phycisphaerales bacterium]